MCFYDPNIVGQGLNASTPNVKISLCSNAGTANHSTPAVPRQKKQSRQELEFSQIKNVSGITPENQDDSTELIYGSTLEDINVSSRLLTLSRMRDEDGDPYDKGCCDTESDPESDSETDSESDNGSFDPDTMNRFVEVFFSLTNLVKAQKSFSSAKLAYI